MIQRLIAFLGALVSLGRPVFRAVKEFVSLGGAPDDIAFWASVFGALSLTDWGLLLIGGACLYYAIRGEQWPQIPSLPGRKIGLTDAARLIYTKASPELRNTISLMDEGGLAPIDGWGRTSIVAAAENRNCVLYGRRGEGLPHEKIPADDLAALHAGDDDSLSELFSDGPKYIDVVISRADVMKVLKIYDSDG